MHPFLIEGSLGLLEALLITLLGEGHLVDTDPRRELAAQLLDQPLGLALVEGQDRGRREGPEDAFEVLPDPDVVDGGLAGLGVRWEIPWPPGVQEIDDDVGAGGA